MFWDNLLVPSSRVKHTAWPLKMGNERLSQNIIIPCVKSQKSADVFYIMAEASNHMTVQHFCISKGLILTVKYAQGLIIKCLRQIPDKARCLSHNSWKPRMLVCEYGLNLNVKKPITSYQKADITGDITCPIVLMPWLLAMITAENPFLTEPTNSKCAEYAALSSITSE